MAEAKIGVIGGSGLYQMEGLADVEEVRLETPFGDPSEKYVLGKIEGKTVAFLARHGIGHRILPSELNFRANIFGFKLLGVEHIISASAVGSLKEDIHPLDVVIPDQLIDRTRGRVSTFFGNGIAAHVEFSHPFCARLSKLLYEATLESGPRVHRGGTYVCIEGPQFSTLAESELYRSWGAHVIGMTNLQEAKLAREAEMSYATLALVTDYDCWREGHEDVTVEAILAVMARNVDRARALIRSALQKIGPVRRCTCGDALRYAILTDPKRIPAQVRDRLGLLIDRYLGT